MKSLSASLSAEILKSKNSLAAWLSFLGSSGIIIAFFVILLLGTDTFLPDEHEHAWKNFYHAYYEGTAFMLLPLFAIIIAALVCYTEYKNGMWKLLLITTISRTELYLSKLLFTYLLIICSHIYFVCLMLLSGFLLAWLRPELGLSSSGLDILYLLKLASKTIISVAAMLALQFWISIRFSSFVVALGIGVIGFILSALLVEGWSYAVYLPYSYPLLYLEEKYLLQPVSQVEVLSMSYCLLGTCLGLLDFRQLKIRT